VTIDDSEIYSNYKIYNPLFFNMKQTFSRFFGTVFSKKETELPIDYNLGIPKSRTFAHKF